MQGVRRDDQGDAHLRRLQDEMVSGLFSGEGGALSTWCGLSTLLGGGKVIGWEDRIGVVECVYILISAVLLPAQWNSINP